LRDKFTIIISDINGSKHYTVSQIIKKVLLYILLLIVVLVIISVIWVRTLLDNLHSIEKRKAEYEKQMKVLALRNDALFEKIKTLQTQIKSKTERLEKINDKISDLENMMGIKTDMSESVDSRIDLLKLTSIQRKVALRNIPNGSPVKYNGVTSSFGWRINPVKKTKEFHPGLDLRAKHGEKIYAPADAIVEFSSYYKGSGYGNLVILDHNFGFKTLYGHLSKRVVEKGDFVKKGDLIGYVGSTGLSTGAHLHYGVMYLQSFINPYYFVKWNENDFDYIFKKERKVKWQSLIKAIQNQIQLLSQQEQK